MKLVQRTMILLTLAAVPAFPPASAFGQNVSCETCTHEVSYFKGSGGLIAKVGKLFSETGDEMTAEEVTWVAQCGGAVRFGQLEPNADGVVSMLFNDENNRACAVDGGLFSLGPITDGGWFWITDDMNSAVGNLVSLNILDNPPVTLADAGSGVTTTEGQGAVFVKETATGRVGILPNILPTPPPAPEKTCGFTGTADRASTTTGKTRSVMNCVIGDGGTVMELRSTDDNGTSIVIPDGALIVRPYAETVRVSAALFGNGTGHFTTDSNSAPYTDDPDLGHPGGTPFTLTGDGAGTNQGPIKGSTGGTEIAGTNVIIPEGTAAQAGASRRGIREDNASEGVFIIAANEGYCGTQTAPKNFQLRVVVESFFQPDDLSQVTPDITGDFPEDEARLDVIGASASFTVVCPSSAAAKSGRAFNPSGVPLG